MSRTSFSLFQAVLWSSYLVAALMLPLSHVRPIRRYLRGRSGIGDACIRTEVIQCGWRVPALLFAVFVTPSIPLFLSIFLDLVGRIGRVVAMRLSERRWHAAQRIDPVRAPTPQHANASTRLLLWSAAAVASMQRARRESLEMRELDPQAFRDLGLHSSELGSYAAEASGAASPTRRRLAIGMPVGVR